MPGTTSSASSYPHVGIPQKSLKSSATTTKQCFFNHNLFSRKDQDHLN
jgi:hypothetical protein